MSDRTQDLLEQALAWTHGLDDGEIPSMLDAQGLIVALSDAVRRYQRRVVAHHEIGTLSEEVLKGYDYHSCPICARADAPREESREKQMAIDGWLAAADTIERPYPVEVFTELSDEEVKLAVETMNGVVPYASERLHARWARHWAKVLREHPFE